MRVRDIGYVCLVAGVASLGGCVKDRGYDILDLGSPTPAAEQATAYTGGFKGRLVNFRTGETELEIPATPVGEEPIALRMEEDKS